jgi:hypothetical protein
VIASTLRAFARGAKLAFLFPSLQKLRELQVQSTQNFIPNFNADKLKIAFRVENIISGCPLEARPSALCKIAVFTIFEETICKD